MKRNQQGFTIVELMIALSVLSVILLLGSVVMIQIGRMYTRGVNDSNLQNATRIISRDISDAIQFSGATPVSTNLGNQSNLINPNNTAQNLTNPNVGAICVGNIRYSFVLGRELGNDNGMPAGRTYADTSSNLTRHVLWRDKLSTTSASCSPANMSAANPSSGTGGSAGYEMMPEHTRLSKLKLCQAPTGSGVWRVYVYAAYGDYDLIQYRSLSNYGINEECSSPATTPAGHATTPFVFDTQAPFCAGGTGSQFCAISITNTTATARVGN